MPVESGETMSGPQDVLEWDLGIYSKKAKSCSYKMYHNGYRYKPRLRWEQTHVIVSVFVIDLNDSEFISTDTLEFGFKPEWEAGFVFKPGWYGNGKAEFGFKPGLNYLSCDGG